MSNKISRLLGAAGVELVSVNSRDNHFQRIEVLKRNRKKRAEYRCFVVEGVAAIKAAIATNWSFEGLCIAADRSLSSWASELVASGIAPRVFSITSDLMQELSEKQDTSEIIALIATRENNLSRINVKHDSIIVVLDRPGSPGNLGSIIRSADAFAADGVIVLGHAADIYDPLSVRSSLGALFSIPVVQLDSPDKLIAWFSKFERPFSLVGTSAKGATSIHDTKFSFPLALIMGNETSGMSKKLEELCDMLVKIPQRGVASSLNLSAASSIFLFLAEKQRLFMR